jgi:hypothetical protein
LFGGDGLLFFTRRAGVEFLFGTIRAGNLIEPAWPSGSTADSPNNFVKSA